MRHAHPDYDDLRALDRKIPRDEPVFLIRAQDNIGAAALRAYHALAVRSGECSQEFLDSIAAHIKAFEAWPKKKVPDLPRTVVRHEHKDIRA